MTKGMYDEKFARMLEEVADNNPTIRTYIDNLIDQSTLGGTTNKLFYTTTSVETNDKFEKYVWEAQGGKYMRVNSLGGIEHNEEIPICDKAPDFYGGAIVNGQYMLAARYYKNVKDGYVDAGTYLLPMPDGDVKTIFMSDLEQQETIAFSNAIWSNYEENKEFIDIDLLSQLGGINNLGEKSLEYQVQLSGDLATSSLGIATLKLGANTATVTQLPDGTFETFYHSKKGAEGAQYEPKYNAYGLAEPYNSHREVIRNFIAKSIIRKN